MFLAQTTVPIVAGFDPTAMCGDLLGKAAPYIGPLLIVCVVLALAYGVKKMVGGKATAIGTDRGSAYTGRHGQRMRRRGMGGRRAGRKYTEESIPF